MFYTVFAKISEKALYTLVFQRRYPLRHAGYNPQGQLCIRLVYQVQFSNDIFVQRFKAFGQSFNGFVPGVGGGGGGGTTHNLQSNLIGNCQRIALLRMCIFVLSTRLSIGKNGGRRRKSSTALGWLFSLTEEIFPLEMNSEPGYLLVWTRFLL